MSSPAVTRIRQLDTHRLIPSKYSEGGESVLVRITDEKCLDPDSYVESQMLAETLLRERASGIIYPSLRHNDGICLAGLCPALVGNVHKSARYRFTWTGSPEPEIKVAQYLSS